MFKTWCDDTDWIHLAQNRSGNENIFIPWCVSYNIIPEVTALTYIQNFLFLFFLCFSYLNIPNQLLFVSFYVTGIATQILKIIH